MNDKEREFVERVEKLCEKITALREATDEEALRLVNRLIRLSNTMNEKLPPENDQDAISSVITSADLEFEKRSLERRLSNE